MSTDMCPHDEMEMFLGFAGWLCADVGRGVIVWYERPETTNVTVKTYPIDEAYRIAKGRAALETP